MIYLRETIDKYGNRTLEIFEGDIEKDKKYRFTTQKEVSVRYFQLKEIK